WIVKNSLEFKNAQRVLVEGNTFENCWPQAQGGQFLLVTPRTQGGQQPWTFTGDIMVRSNSVKHVTNGFAVAGVDDFFVHPHTARVAIMNNLIEDMGAFPVTGANTGDLSGPGGGFFDLTFDHNTVINQGLLVRIAGAQTNTNLTFQNEIV